MHDEELILSEDSQEWTLFSQPTPTLLAGVPIALSVAWVMTKLGFITALFWYFISIPTHEMGHACAAWFGSRFALPVGALIPMAAFTFAAEGRSVIFGTVLVGLLGFAAYYGFRAKNKTLILFAVCSLVTWFNFTWLMNPLNWERLQIWGGIGGEFLLGTFLIILCFYELPEKWRWSFFKPFALLYGSYAYVAAFSKWIAIRAHEAEIPFGSFLSGGGDSMGDMERLIDLHHWTQAKIIQSYFQLGVFCAILIGAHWIYFAWTYIFSSRPRTSQR